jgi:putative peptide zinc metalloprotease protein
MPEPDVTVYALSRATEIHPLDTSDSQRSHLIRCDGRQFAVTASVARLVEALGEGEGTLAQLSERLRLRGVAGATPDRLGRLLAPLSEQGIVRDGGGSPPAPERREAVIRLRRTVLRPESVRTIVSILAQLFRPLAATAVLAGIAAAHVWFYAAVFPTFTWRLGALPAPYYLLLMLLTTATTLVHELGHAAACRRYGCPHGPIGWGVYLFTPVFYTDVSQVWRLPRRQRAVVDVGGVYFEAAAAAAVLVLYLATGHPVLVYAFLLIDISCVSQMTPVLRRDGYWLVADLAGHSRLREASADVVRRLVARWTRRDHTAAAAPPPAGGLVVAYTLASVLLTAALFGWLSVRVALEAAPALPRLAVALVSGPHDPASLAAALLRLLLNAAFLALVTASAVRFVRALGPWLRGTPAVAAKGVAP